MPHARTALIMFLLGVCLGAPASRAGIVCAAGAATASGPAKQGFDLVPCADEDEGQRVTDSTAGARVTREIGPLLEWIAARTGWPLHDAPPVKFVPRKELVKMFGGTADGFHVEALYSDRDHSIYLADGWKPDNLRRRSILLHELVHHLQYLNHVRVTCESEHELQAFKLQFAWLGERGVVDPPDYLGIDPFLLLMLGKCDEMSMNGCVVRNG